MTPAAALVMSDGQREALQALSRSQTAPHRQVQRARALLLAADGVANVRIAAQVGVKPATVRSWRARFAEEGLAKLGKVRPGRGRKSTIAQEKIDEIVHLTRYSTPDGQTHWSCRTMAAKAGVSPATVQRVWAARGLKPHLVKTFKLSNDPKFEEKLVDVVGLYLDLPDQAVVLCMDEKSQIQALDRTQPGLPMKQGPGRHHDPRLQAQRHHHAVRRAERADRRGHRAMPAEAPPRGVLEVPAHGSTAKSPRAWRCT